MCELKRDIIAHEAVASQHCSAVRSDTGKKRVAFCVRVPRHECLPANEREKKVIFRASNQEYHVPNSARFGLYAQK